MRTGWTRQPIPAFIYRDRRAGPGFPVYRNGIAFISVALLQRWPYRHTSFAAYRLSDKMVVHSGFDFADVLRWIEAQD